MCSKVFIDAVIQRGLKENKTDAACTIVDQPAETYPVIIVADRGYENYNLFAHIEKRLFNYVIRIRDIGSRASMSSEFDFPSEGTFDLTRDIIITRQSTRQEIKSNTNISANRHVLIK